MARKSFGTLATFMVCLETALAFINPLLLRSPTGGVGGVSSKLVNLVAKCDKSGLILTVQFDKPFRGTIYSMGFFGNPECTYVAPSSAGHLTYTFLVPVNKCGTQGRYEEPKPGQKVTIRNTVVVQNDPDFITAEDSAHALSCTWADSYYKPVTARPVQVEDDPNNRVVPVVLNAIGTGAPSDRRHNVASGLFHTEKEKNVIISVMDPFDQYDASALDCMAFDQQGGNAIALTDKNGCMLQVSLMPPFKKLRSPGVGLTLYSTIKDSKLAENKDLVIKCNIQVCQKECQTPCVATPTSKKGFKVLPFN